MPHNAHPALLGLEICPHLSRGDAREWTEPLVFTDEQWAALEPLVEACRPKGKTPPRDLRRTVEAIVWRHRNGATWRAIPAEPARRPAAHRGRAHPRAPELPALPAALRAPPPALKVAR